MDMLVCVNNKISKTHIISWPVSCQHGPNRPQESLRHMLPESRRPPLPGQQTATSLSSQVRSLAPGQSPDPSPSLHIPAHHHGYAPAFTTPCLPPDWFSPPGLPVATASSIDQGTWGIQTCNATTAEYPHRGALPREPSLVGDTPVDTLGKLVEDL